MLFDFGRELNKGSVLAKVSSRPTKLNCVQKRNGGYASLQRPTSWVPRATTSYHIVPTKYVVKTLKKYIHIYV